MATRREDRSAHRSVVRRASAERARARSIHGARRAPRRRLGEAREGVPATEFARRSLVSCSAANVRSAVDGAIRLGRERGIVVVDHTIDRAIWRCRLDDETRTFLAADEHANRGEIHPCRTPWETVCVEPNGNIRVVDFFGAIVGNITRAGGLAGLWNASAAVEARERSKLSRLCGPAGPATCVGP